MGDCEEDLCEDFGLAVCLHCMRRLCISHINDHQNVLLNKIDQLKNEANQVSSRLINVSDTIIEERQADIKKCAIWRIRKLAEINDEYSNMMSSIRIRQKTLEQLKLSVDQRLKMYVQEPLEHLLTQKSVNPQALDAIQSAIETIKKDNDRLIWNSPELNSIQNLEEETIFTPARPRKKEKPYDIRNELFPFFRNVNRNNADKIHDFIQTRMEGKNSMEKQGLITLILCYLFTWHRATPSQVNYKQSILNRHILTVKEYIIGKDCERKVFIALQRFFITLKKKEPAPIEIMTMLLQLFLDHQCISIPKTIEWYLEKNSTGEIIDKKWMEPFLEFHGYQIESTMLPTNTFKTVRIRRPYRYLVKSFQARSDLSATIHEYVQMQCSRNGDYRVIMLVRSYLHAWNESLANIKNDVLLNKIGIIKYYEHDFDFEMQIIFAIEVFISQSRKKDDWSIQTISTLFQFFLDQNLLTKEIILQWNSNGHLYNQDYYKQIKRLAQPFIQQLTTDVIQLFDNKENLIYM